MRYDHCLQVRWLYSTELFGPNWVVWSGDKSQLGVGSGDDGVTGVRAEVSSVTETRRHQGDSEAVRPIGVVRRACPRGCGGDESKSDHPCAIRWRCDVCAMSSVDWVDDERLSAGCLFPASSDTLWLTHSVTVQRVGAVVVCFDGVEVLRVSQRLALTLRDVCSRHDELASESAVNACMVHWCDRWARDPARLGEDAANVTWLQRLVTFERPKSGCASGRGEPAGCQLTVLPVEHVVRSAEVRERQLTWPCWGLRGRGICTVTRVCVASLWAGRR